MAQKLVAIDMAPHHARIVVLDATLRESRLVSIKSVSFSEEAESIEKWEVVKEALPSTYDTLVVAVDPSTASSRRLSLPFSDLRKVEAALDFELENLIPFEIDDVVSTWTVAERTPDQTTLLVSTMQREALESFFTQTKEAQLEPRIAALPAAALAGYHLSAEGPVAVASLGESYTHLMVKNGPLSLVRTLRTGGKQIDLLLAKRFNLSLEEARVAKEKESFISLNPEGLSEEHQKISSTMQDALRSLVRELRSSFKQLPAEQAPGVLYLTGGLSRLPGLADYLSHHLDFPVRLLDLEGSLGNVDNKVGVISPEYSVALGLGLLAGARGQNTPHNFRRGEFSYQGDLQLYRREFAHIAVGIAIVLLMAIGGSVTRYTMAKAEEERLDQSFCDVTQKIVGREICDPMAALATMRHSGGGEGGTEIPSYSTVHLFEMVSRMITKDLDVVFEDLEFRLSAQGEGDRISAKGEADSFDTIEKLVAIFKTHSCIEDAEVSKQRKKRNSTRVEFSFSTKVKCLPGVNPLNVLKEATGTAAGGR